MIYLASPHSHIDRTIVDQRFLSAVRACALLMLRGYRVYSPIVFTHPIWRFAEEDSTEPPEGTGELFHKPHQFWMDYDRYMMALCDECIVLKIPGYDVSLGVSMEVSYFERAGKLIRFMSMEDIVELPPCS